MKVDVDEKKDFLIIYEKETVYGRVLGQVGKEFNILLGAL